MDKIFRFLGLPYELKVDRMISKMHFIYDRFDKSYVLHQKLITKYLQRFIAKRENELSVQMDMIHSQKNTTRFNQAPIWFFWDQGWDNLPLVLKMNFMAIKKHSNHHPVIFLSESKLSEYINLNPTIFRLKHQRVISLAHFSDIVRTNLLAKYGGLWIDSTIYLADELDESHFNLPILSLRSEMASDNQYVSKGRWTGYFLGTNQSGHKLFTFLAAFFNMYWDNSEDLIDYFLLDYAINYAYINFTDVRGDLMSLSRSDLQRFELRRMMNLPFASVKNDFKEMLRHNHVFKLSIDDQYIPVIDGSQTVFGYLLQENGLNKSNNAL